MPVAPGSERMSRVRNTSRTIPGPLCMWKVLCSEVTIPAASCPRCCSSSSPSYSSWLTGVFATTPRMPHMGPISLRSSIFQVLSQVRRKVRTERERRGLERPGQEGVAPEALARKGREPREQHDDQYHEQPPDDPEQQPQRAVRGRESRGSNGRS